MDGLLDSPAFVVVALTLASAFLLIEVALPTLGIAGACGLALLVTGGLAVERQDHAPLLLAFIALGVCLWAVCLLRRSAGPTSQALAAGAYALGAIGYGVVAEDLAATLVGAAATVGLAASFPSLLAATRRLLDQPAQVGMESTVGRKAVVVAWSGDTGTVRLEGSLWNAVLGPGASDTEGAAVLKPGTPVRVDAYEAMLLTVSPLDQPAPPRRPTDG